MKKLIILLIILLMAFGIRGHFIPKDKATLAVPLLEKTIVIDAGHGGFDPGAISPKGIKEKDINLAVSRYLVEFLRQAGARVIMTREEDVALGDTKKADMLRRVEITKEAKADVFISIQANSIPEKKWRGAQVFYHKKGEEGKALAENIQKSIREELNNTTRQAQAIANKFVVDKQDLPSIVVEVGFLSNPEEEELLQSSQYQQKMAYGIYKGILNYYSQKEQ